MCVLIFMHMQHPVCHGCFGFLHFPMCFCLLSSQTHKRCHKTLSNTVVYDMHKIALICLNTHTHPHSDQCPLIKGCPLQYVTLAQIHHVRVSVSQGKKHFKHFLNCSDFIHFLSMQEGHFIVFFCICR